MLNCAINVVMPESMLKCLERLSKTKNCSNNTLVKLAIAKFLFDQNLPKPEIATNEHGLIQVKSNNISEEIPIDKIVSIQYNLNDGRVIYIVRQSKLH